MGYDDKIEHKGQESAGYVEQGVGEATGNERLQAEGQKDKRAGKLKQAGEKIKGAFKK